MEGNIVGAEKVFSEGTEVEVTSFEEGFRGAWFGATILKTPINKSKGKKVSVQYDNLLAVDNKTLLTERVKLSLVRPLPPQTQTPPGHCYQVDDVVDAFHLDGWWVGSVSQVLHNQNKYVVSFVEPPEKIEFSPSDLRPHWDWVDGKWVKSSKIQEDLVSCSKEPVELSCNSLQDARATLLRESSDAIESGQKTFERYYARRTKGLLSASKGPASKHVKRATPEDDATPLRSSKKFKDGSSENSLLLESHMKVAAIEIYEAEEMTNEVEPSFSKRLPAECMNGSEPEESWHLTKEINLEKEHGINRYQKENGAKSVINRTEQPRVVYEINQPKVVFQIIQSPYSERTGVVFGEDCQRKIIEEAGKSGGLYENDEQSPFICDKEQQSRSQKIHSVLEQYSEYMAEKSPQIMAQPPLFCKTGANVPVEGQEIPFVKSLPILKGVELMEILQVIPQNPHFKPLTELNEILREAVAVGHMLTFASMVQKTSKLTVADPKNFFTSILDALFDLEKHGFDVKAVQNRASDLMFMQDRHKHIQDHLKEVEGQVTKISDVLTKINEEIDANIKLMKELQERQELLLSMQKSKTSELALLQANADVTTGDILDIEYDFETLAARPW